jgi:hypothetical protein
MLSLRFSSATCVLGAGIFEGKKHPSEDEDEDEAAPVGEYRGDVGLQETGMDLDRLSLSVRFGGL